VGIELHTPRLLLRPFQPGDVDDALAYRDDREFARYLPHVPQPFTRADAEAFVARNIEEPWELFPTFAVVLAGRVIGTANLMIDPAKRGANLGYAIARALGPRHRDRGRGAGGRVGGSASSTSSRSGRRPTSRTCVRSA
jgi:RimJ/RimL family protein N-acetyltransferase